MCPIKLCADAVVSHQRVVRKVKLESNTAEVRRARNGIIKQLPNGLRTRPRVRISVHSGEVVATGNVNFDYRAEIHLVKKGESVEAMIAGVGIKVVQIEQQAAPGTLRQL